MIYFTLRVVAMALARYLILFAYLDPEGALPPVVLVNWYTRRAWILCKDFYEGLSFIIN